MGFIVTFLYVYSLYNNETMTFNLFILNIYHFFVCVLRQGFFAYPCLSWNSLWRPGWPQISTCLCLLSTVIEGVYHYNPAIYYFFLVMRIFKICFTMLKYEVYTSKVTTIYTFQQKESKWKKLLSSCSD